MTNRKYSKELVDGPNQAASRAMLRGAGFTTEDFTKSFIGIASTGAKVTPCNMHINELSEIVEKSVNASGGKGILFNTCLLYTSTSPRDTLLSRMPSSA